MEKWKQLCAFQEANGSTVLASKRTEMSEQGSVSREVFFIKWGKRVGYRQPVHYSTTVEDVKQEFQSERQKLNIREAIR